MVISELIDVLFYKNIKEFLRFYRKIDEKYYSQGNFDEYSRHFNNYIVDKIKTKENFIKLIDDYNINGKTIWQKQESQNCDILSNNDVINALKNGSREIGEKRYLQYKKAAEEWAFHLDDYTNAVNFNDNINILELSTGAGVGTCAVMTSLLPNNRLISVDIDFAAARNADGLAQYLNITDRACGLNANFWCLPFEDCTFDTVCSHLGIDESGEIETVLKEASRVLKDDGRFVIVARKNPYERHKNTMDLFDINESECVYLLKKARLYSGFENFVESAEKYNLSLTEHKLYDDKRILYIFQKKI